MTEKKIRIKHEKFDINDIDFDSFDDDDSE